MPPLSRLLEGVLAYYSTIVVDADPPLWRASCTTSPITVGGGGICPAGVDHLAAAAYQLAAEHVPPLSRLLEGVLAYYSTIVVDADPPLSSMLRRKYDCMACDLALEIRKRSIINILSTRCVVGLVSKNFRPLRCRHRPYRHEVANVIGADCSCCPF